MLRRVIHCRGVAQCLDPTATPPLQIWHLNSAPAGSLLLASFCIRAPVGEVRLVFTASFDFINSVCCNLLVHWPSWGTNGCSGSFVIVARYNWKLLVINDSFPALRIWICAGIGGARSRSFLISTFVNCYDRVRFTCYSRESCDYYSTEITLLMS